MRNYKNLAATVVILCVLICTASSAHSATIYVPAKFSTIQAGITAASTGDTIIVGTGVYEEDVTLKDNVALIGLGLPAIGSHSSGSLTAGNNCKIDGFKIHALEITGKSGVTIQNCVLFGKDDILTSATISGSSGIVIQNNTFSDEYYGGTTDSNRVDISGTQDLTFKNNVVLTKNLVPSTANITALSLNNVSNASITNNFIKADSCNTGVGISLASMTAATIRNNIVCGTTYSINGNSTNVTISYNDLPEGVNRVGPDITLGPNNFSAEPVFTEGKGYYLKPSSPCVDAGIIEESNKTEIGAHQKITYLNQGDSLQAAINNATPNETIYLGPNDPLHPYPAEQYTIKSEDGTADVTSYGILVIAKDIHIVGSGKSNTFVKGPVQFIFSNGSLENLTVMSPNELDVDHIAEIDYDLDGRWDHDFTGSVLIANGSAKIENVMLEPDLSVLGDPPAIPPIGIAIIENTSGSPTSPIIRNVTLKKFADAIKIEGKHDELVLSLVVEHCVFDQNTNGINCDTPYTLLALRNSIFSNMTTAIDLAKTPYKKNIIDNIQSNLFYDNTNNCLYNVTESIDVFANKRNNQAGEPKYLRPALNVYVTLFDSPAVAIDAGLDFYCVMDENGNIIYYESPLRDKMLAVVDSTGGTDYDSKETILKYNQSTGDYAGKTIRYFVTSMAELKYYEEYAAGGVLQGTYYADETPYPDETPGVTAPAVAITAPSGPGLLKGIVPITWTATDADGDPLSINIKLSTNGGTSFDVDLASGLENDQVYEWGSADHADGSNCKIKVIAYKTNDSDVYSEAISSDTFILDNTLPAISITYPSDNTGLETAAVTVKINASDSNFGTDPVEVKVTDDPDWQVATFVTDHYEAEVNLPTDGTRAIIVARATDGAGNISTDKVGVIKGYMRYIELPKYYNKEANLQGLSSVAVAQDLIHLMSSTDYSYTGMPDETDMYDYGLTYNYSGHRGLGSELDAQGLSSTLQNYDPYGSNYIGYNFGITAIADFDAYLKDIVHWLSWAIKKPGVTTPRGTPEQYPDDYCRAPYMAALAPLSAYIQGYSRWVAINGCAADKSPVSTTQPWKSGIVNNVTVYGLFMSDPQIRGIGQDMYIPAANLSDYLQPLGPGISDPYIDKYVTVVEPPAETGFELDLAEPVINKSTLTLLNIAKFVNSEIADDFSRHLVDGALVMDLDESNAVKSFSTSADLVTLFAPETADEDNSNLNWKDIIPSARLLNEDFIAAVDNSEVRDFIKVQRNDTEGDYYIIPFDKYVNGQYLSKAAILMDAATSAIIADSYVKEPTRYMQLTKEEAIAKVIESHPELASKGMEARLVWKQGGMTPSPFYPYWEVMAGESLYYILKK